MDSGIWDRIPAERKRLHGTDRCQSGMHHSIGYPESREYPLFQGLPVLQALPEIPDVVASVAPLQRPPGIQGILSQGDIPTFPDGAGARKAQPKYLGQL